MEDLDADFQNHGLDILEIIIDKLRNAESNRCCLGILLKRMETLKIVLDGPGRKIKIDSFANIYTLIQSAEVISNLYCYHVSKTYYQHPVKAGKAREEIQHLVEHIGISLQETSLDNFAQVAPMQEYSLLFDTAELNDNSATVLALQGMPELEDTDMLDAVVDEFRARNSLLAAGLSKGRSVGGDPAHRVWAVRLEEVSVAAGTAAGGAPAANRFRGAPVALKGKTMSPSARIDPRALRQLPFELSVLYKLRHPNVCACHGASVGFQHASTAAQPLYTLLLEWSHHSLREEIERPHLFPGSLLRDYGPASDEQRVQLAKARPPPDFGRFRADFEPPSDFGRFRAGFGSPSDIEPPSKLVQVRAADPDLGAYSDPRRRALASVPLLRGPAGRRSRLWAACCPNREEGGRICTADPSPVLSLYCQCW